MPDTHGSHELIELLAALILSIGGGAILVRAWLVRRGREPHRTLAVPAVPTALRADPADRRSALRGLRRAVASVIVGLSAGAAIIHLAAGPEHVEAFGDLGLGFYAAGLFQAAFAIAWWTSRAGSRRLAIIGLAVNGALLIAWAWSRTIGLPTVVSGPEAPGVADVTVVGLQLALIVLLAIRFRGLDRRVALPRSPALLRTVTTSGLVAVLGVIALSTTIALASTTSGHSHDDGAHTALEDGPAQHPGHEPIPPAP